MVVKALIFDFWGTLVENGVWSPIKQVRNILRISLPFSEYVVRMERAMMTRQFSDLREAFQAVCQEFQLESDQETLERLIGLWNKSWMLAYPYEEVPETLRELGGKYTLALISNTDCFSVEKVIEKFSLAELFDRTFFSYERGMIKTDRNFFLMVLKELGLSTEECVVVGDSLQSDILPAKRLNFKAILVDRKNGWEFHPKIKNLKELEKALLI